MRRWHVTITPHGSVFIGGYSQNDGSADGVTAADEQGVLIPGSVLKGALREAALRITQALGRGGDLLDRLFGEASGRAGLLRVGMLRALIPAELSLRHHVSLERSARQAAPERLFAHRVSAAGLGLCFRGEIVAHRGLDADEQGLLDAAVELTDQLGGGRGRGLGHVRVTLEKAEPSQTKTPDFDPDLGQLTLVLSAEEPLQLGVIKDRTNVNASKTWLDGSAVRGAVAAGLTRRVADTERSAALEAIVGGTSPAVFGDGHPEHPSAIPAPLTLREPKGGGELTDLAANLCAGRGDERAFDTRAVRGTVACPDGRWQKVELARRTVTRTARNPVDGRAADGLLFSLEVVEPPSVFYVPVQGSPDQLRAIVETAAGGLWVGGVRSRGFGRVTLADVCTLPPLAPLAERHARWVERVGTLGGETPEASGVLLALGPVAVSQDRLHAALAAVGLELVGGVARRRAHGGWNREVHLPRLLAGAFVPGSVWIVRRRDGSSALPALTKLETQGIGPGRPDGWGRLAACHPIHVECSKEDSQCQR